MSRLSMSTLRYRRMATVRVVTLAVLACSSLIGVPVRAQAQWAAPFGVPVPNFGLAQTAPAPPTPWVLGTPGFYYVDATDAASTDDLNPFGTPARPRNTIPIELPAGAVVQLH